MNKTLILTICLSALLVFLSGCAKQQPDVSRPDGDVSVSLALSVGGARQSGTKMAESITQSSMTPESFRGIDRVFILPFKTGSSAIPIQLGDEAWDVRLALPQLGLDASFDNTATANNGLVYNNFSHLYSRVVFRPETDAVLVYGKAPDNEAGKRHNGSLISPDLDLARSTDEIIFSPDPIIPSDQNSVEYYAYNETWKNKTIDYLNGILTVYPKGKSAYRFNDPSTYNYHPGLTTALEDFTNEGIYFPLSAEVLADKLTKLYRAVYPYASDKSKSAKYYTLINGVAYAYVYELANAVLTQVYDATKTSSENTYTSLSGSGTGAKITMKTNGPVTFGLPAGTIPIQWQEGKGTFKIVYNIDHYTGLGYVPANRFCYPPSLWYYVNSPLVSTDQEGVEEKYTSTYDWPAIRSNYSIPGIGSKSKAAAISNPLQYGVALLKLACQKASADYLRDYAGKNIEVKNNKFPLTGIVIADQYPQLFDFTPEADADPDNSVPMRYIYDSEVNDSNGNARAWLSKTQTSAELSSLVFPTRPGADVRFALEFLNNSSNTVVGANGCKIAPGCHFYLAGILKFSEATGDTGGDHVSVFLRDHFTQVNASFNSLKAAYDVIPDLSDPQLQMGVKAEFGWDLSTPTNVPVVIQ